jgi:hypothetical protein
MTPAEQLALECLNFFSLVGMSLENKQKPTNSPDSCPRRISYSFGSASSRCGVWRPHRDSACHSCCSPPPSRFYKLIRGGEIKKKGFIFKIRWIRFRIGVLSTSWDPDPNSGSRTGSGSKKKKKMKWKKYCLVKMFFILLFSQNVFHFIV